MLFGRHFYRMIPFARTCASCPFLDRCFALHGRHRRRGITTKVTMVLPVVATAARRRASVFAKEQVQKRSMGGGPAPEWEGIDKVVRGVFPADYQLAMAIMRGYAGLIGLSSMGGGKKEEKTPAPVASTASVAGAGVPAIGTPEFDKFLETDAFDKLLNSDEQLGKVLADMK